MENGVETVSSEALASAAGVKPTQMRKDFGYIGQFGTRGLGYGVETLSEAITEALGRASLRPVVLIGVGNLGSALLRYGGFQREGFEVIAAFDKHPDRVPLRDRPASIPILPPSELSDLIRERSVKMAILAVPGEHAQSVANRLVEVGIQAILNFSPAVLQVPEHVTVNSVDLALELESLSYFVH